jgi:hypothetical protein
VTSPSIAETTTGERDATVNSFSGGSPPRGTRFYKGNAAVCSQGHDLTKPDSFYLTPTGRKTCQVCRMAFIEQLRKQWADPARAKRIAAANVERHANQVARREAQRAGRALIREARRIAKERAR